MKAVHIVITPKANVIVANHILGPNFLTAIVEGSWKAMLEIVKMKMATLYRFPDKSRSFNIEVTLAEEMIPESRRLREHKMPAMVQRRRSTFRRKRFSSASSSGVGS